MEPEERIEQRISEELNLGLPLATEFDIVCSMTGQPAELFTRNEKQRLVPLTRQAFEKMITSQKGLLKRYPQWQGHVYQEISLEDGQDEYRAQPPNAEEKKRREVAVLLKDLVVETILWSQQPVDTAKAVAYYMKDKSLDNIVVTDLCDYPQKGMQIILLANKELTPEQMRALWDLNRIGIDRAAIPPNPNQVPKTQ